MWGAHYNESLKHQNEPLSEKGEIMAKRLTDFFDHANYPGVWSLQDKTKIARQTLYFGGSHNSRIELPII